MPLQHAHPDTLRRMRRPANMDWVHQTLEKMRQRLPTLALRTTFIGGYPGETDEQFQTLLDFVREIRFDKVGAFQFSFEPGTASQIYGDPVPAEVCAPTPGGRNLACGAGGQPRQFLPGELAVHVHDRRPRRQAGDFYVQGNF